MKKIKIWTNDYIQQLKISAKNRNLVTNKLMKIFILVILFVFSVTFLFTLENNFFRFTSLTPQNSLYRVLFNTTQEWRDINGTNIISSFLFYLMIIFSLLKNYINVNKNQILLKKYIPFYVIYLAFTFLVIGIYFSLASITKGIDIWYVVIITTLAFLAINVASIFVSTMFSFKKMNPMEVKNQKIYIISYVFRFVLYVVLFYLIYSFFNINSTNVLFDNSITSSLKTLFNITSPLHTFAITAIFTAIIILFLAANLQTLYKIFRKERSFESFKELFIFLGVITSAMVIWLFSRFSHISQTYTIFESSASYQYVFVLSAIINIAIFVGYIIIKKFNLVKRDIFKKTLDYSLIFIIWIIIAAIQISIETHFVILLVNLLTAIITTFTILTNTIYKEKTMLLENQILLILFILSVLVFSFVSIFKIDLINDGNYVVYRQVLGMNILSFTSLLPVLIMFILLVIKGLSISLYTYNISLKEVVKNKIAKYKTNKKTKQDPMQEELTHQN